MSAGSAIIYESSANFLFLSSDSDNEKQQQQQRCEERADESRAKILSASMQFVPKYGWTVESLAAGSQAIGYPGIAHGLFHRGGFDLLNHFQITSNDQLAEQLRVSPLTKSRDPAEVTTYLRNAIETRLRMILPYIDTWPDAMALSVLPANVPDSLYNVSTLVDDIWYYAGDRSTDFGWYKRRAGLVEVYVTTELVMVQDKSDDYSDTWTYLKERLEGYQNLDRRLQKVDETIQELPSLIKATVIIAQNILGIRKF